MDLIKSIKGIEYFSIGEDFDYLRFANGYLGLKIFPIVKTPNLKVAIMNLLKGHSVPVIALVHAFDSESLKGDRPEFEEFREELLLIKQSLNQGEELRKRFRDAGLNITERMIIEGAYNDATNLISAILTRLEAMADELLSSGYITINENDINKVIDYGFPTKNRITFTDWNDPNHDILGDLRAFKINNPKVVRVYTTTSVIGWMLGNTTINNVVENVPPYFATQEWLKGYISSLFGIEVVNVDEQMSSQTYKRRYHDTIEYRFFPKEFMTFVETTGILGKTFTTYTPIEDLGAVNGGVDYSETANVVVYTDITKDPAQVKTIAEGVGLPVPANKNGMYFISFI